jgi:hypothetical protein
VCDFSENRERVIGIEPTTLCLASTRSSQLSYTRKSEEVLVLPRLCRVKLERQGRPFHPVRQHCVNATHDRPALTTLSAATRAARCAVSGVMQ